MNTEEVAKKTVFRRIMDFFGEVLKVMIMTAAAALVHVGITAAFCKADIAVPIPAAA